MSPYATITTIYRVEVAVPEDVFRAFGHTNEYDQVSGDASLRVAASGQNAYSDVIEWGESPVRRDCEDFANHWHNWILQWQERLRTSHGPHPDH